MKINIDLRNASWMGGGISNYVRQLSSRLIRYSDLDIVGCFNMDLKKNKSNYKWFKGNLHASFLGDRIVYNSHVFKSLSYESIMRSIPDLNIFLTYRLPYVKFKSPTVATIHDIILLRGNYGEISLAQSYGEILQHTISKVDRLLTVSSFSKQDIVDYFNFDPHKIFVVHNGIDWENCINNTTPHRLLDVKIKYNLPEKFILYFGAYRKHKNIEHLLQVYATLPKEFRNEVKLVITSKVKELLQLACSLKIFDDVIFTGFVDEKDKFALYKSASLVYYASYYEGFGVPIIEAQSCKVPVITSNTSSMPEASGGNAILVDPYSIDEIRDAIISYFADPKEYKGLIDAGFVNAQKYTWENSVQELHDFILNS